MSNPNPAIPVDGAVVSVDALAAATGARLEAMTMERTKLVASREQLTVQIKALDVEIDKASRMVRSLIPRGQRGKATEATPAVQP